MIDKHIRSSPAFKFLEPTEVKLTSSTGDEDDEDCTFQYVSIVDTIATIVSDPDFSPERPSQDELLRDVKDASVYRK
jgi:hypothetical protein